MADEPIGVTETSGVGLARITPVLQSILAEEAVLYPSIADYSGWAQKGDKSVGVPRSDRFTVQDKTENTDLESQNMTFAADTISLDKYKTVYARLEDKAGLQAVPDVQGRIAEDMAAGMVEQWESDIATELYDASTATPDHVVDSDGYGLAETDFREAKRLLDVAKVRKNDRFVALHPTQVKEILAISNFIQQDRYPQQMALMNGELGMAYGFKVLESAECTENNAAFYHRSHVGFAAQKDMELEVQRAPLAAQSWDHALSAIYGVTELDNGQRGVLIEVQTN